MNRYPPISLCRSCGSPRPRIYQRGSYTIALRVFIPLLLILVCAALLLFLRFDSARIAYQDAEYGARLNLQRLAFNMQDELRYYIREGAYSRVHEKFAMLSSMPEIKFGMLVDTQGNIRSATNMSWIGKRLADWINQSEHSPDIASFFVSDPVKFDSGMTVDTDNKIIYSKLPVQMDIEGARLRPTESGSLILLQDFSLDLMQRYATNYNWLVRVGLILGTMILAIGLVLHFLVSRRIGKLVSAANRIRAGDLDVRVDIAGTDELYKLGSTFNSMVVDLARSSAQVRKLTRAVDQAPVTIIITNLAGLIEYVNPHFTTATGYEADEVLGGIVMNPELGLMPFAENSQIWQVIMSGESWFDEVQSRRKDGTLYWERISISPIRDERGEIVHMLWVREDITRRKQDEANLTVFARIFEAMNEAVIVTDAKSNILFTNAAFTSITGYQHDDVVRMNPSILTSGLMDADFYENMWRSIHETGRWQGEIIDKRKNGETYTQSMSIYTLADSNGEISHYISVFSDISERKAVEQRMAYMAQHDNLTDLPNRVLLLDRLSQAISRAFRDQHKISIMFLDLDNFKATNDTLGHQVGDMLLKEVANRIRSVARSSDTISRQGGDEFVLMLPDIDNADDATAIAGKLLAAVSGSCLIEGNEIEVTTSIGISIYPEDGPDADTLLKHADAAMYYAKRKGRNNFQFFTSEMNRHALERMSIERKLRHAIERNELYLDYQPQVDIRSGRIIGAEALLRWKSPELGIVPPGKFIHIAEDNGLIVPIGEWVLRTACEQSLAWRKEGLPPVTMAVNLSPVQFRQKNIGDLVLSILLSTGLDVRSLELEITESAVMHDADAAIEQMHKLKEVGVMLAMDDFGIGYSSLNYLKRFPIVKLKIDQSFVRDITIDPDDAAIVTTIISMAHNLSLRVIAEGVETLDQMSFLQNNQCDEMQGYYFSRPVSPEQFVELLRAK